MRAAAGLIAVAALAVLLTPHPAMAQSAITGLCDKDPELAEIAASNPAVAQCCSQFDALLANIDAVLAQGVTALVPVMSCTLLPPVELSQECYQDLLSAGANCYYETNVMIQFFNETGLLGTAVDASKTGEVSNETVASLPTEEEFKEQALAYLPTAKSNLKAMTGSDTMNPICCNTIGKLIEDKCACEEKPITFVQSRLDKVGMKIEDWVDFGKEVVSGMGCDSAQDLQVYPACTKP